VASLDADGLVQDDELPVVQPPQDG
jgi:hypothetical protein